MVDPATGQTHAEDATAMSTDRALRENREAYVAPGKVSDFPSCTND